MSRSEQSVVREMCQTFLHDNVPEYIRDAAYYILSEGEVQKINIQDFTKNGYLISLIGKFPELKRKQIFILN